jgi:hypothetical protein
MKLASKAVVLKSWVAILFACAFTVSCFAQYDAIHQASLDGDLDKVKVLLKANPELVSSTVSTWVDGFARSGVSWSQGCCGIASYQ